MIFHFKVGKGGIIESNNITIHCLYVCSMETWIDAGYLDPVQVGAKLLDQTGLIIYPIGLD